MSSRHDGVTCDACSQRDFRLRRYKCLVCCDYDLCGACFDNQCETNQHLRTHPMQCLIPKADHKLFYNGETSTEYSAQSFTCPLCGQLGFTEASFSRHVFQKHPGQEAGDTDVLCPLCATHTGSDPNTKIRFMARHLVTTHRLSAPSNGPNPRNHDSSGSTSADDFEKYADSSRQQFAARRLMPLLIARSHRAQDGNRTRTGVVGQRKGRSNRLSDSLSAQNDSSAVAEKTSSHLAQTASGGSQATVSSARVTRLSQSNGGQNSHNGMVAGSSAPSAPLQPRASHIALTASDAVSVDNVAGTSVSAVANTTEALSDQFNIDVVETPRSVNIKNHQTEVDTGVTNKTCPAVVAEVDRSATAPSSQSTVPVLQDPPQKGLLRESVSGDPIGKQSAGPAPVASIDKETEPSSSNVATSVPSAPVRDEFDANWVAFLHELIWSSLYVSSASSQAEDSFPNSG
ncbi:E3 ubiquitin-protein ligase KCMF1 [Fasciola gigantica]|uniref:E3 ubiquitin-protein ligase KCMF1 n=1 Tax=Fasciola gigantica TaxID=46835 RepID=A0A504Y2M6_FASGI|nr:E3 ubiquitin-protein ligase KCMF1 [Fasciola gigantica]